MTARAENLDRMVALANEGALEDFVALAHGIGAADLADVLAALGDRERLEVVQALPPELSSHALIEMPDEAHAEDTLAALDAETAAEIVEELEDDDAADLLGELEPEDQERILSEVEDRAEVERLLSYDEESAGGLMTASMVTVPDSATVADALVEIRRQSGEVEDFYEVFVVDRDRRLVGVLPLRDLVTSLPARPVREITQAADVTVPPETDQEEVARLMARYNVASIPVVDPAGRLLGRVTFDDVVDVAEAEATEDLLQFGGVSADEDLGGGWRDAVRSRLPWLLINLLTAFVAGAVVYSQQEVITHVVALAAFMPIVAGMGGNAGTQALAVTVRRLALGLISQRQFARTVAKEILAGLTNGLLVGLVAGVAAFALGHGLMLGVVVFSAMVGNLVIAGFAGAFIPIVLERFKVDPAIASSVFVTTFTDICGFTLLLGLASRFLL